MIAIAVISLVLGYAQFDETDRPKTAGKESLRLEVLQVSPLKNGKVRLRLSLVNKGRSPASVPPLVLNSSFTSVAFSDAKGKRVRFRGDNIGAYVPVLPEDALALPPGFSIGFDRDFYIVGSPKGLKVTAA